MAIWGLVILVLSDEVGGDGKVEFMKEYWQFVVMYIVLELLW